ncbi:DUF3298 and DUF4163 domain-containing protein [Neobacillus pocheonensis]|uniref:DUF3298 and DUF4163 domain-containing protein n=1 Tax=Neobacillus pocheonensis TaxID=363869 RepID=A0ABT0W760_9BACI|nr:DUF3298 and DUF4163 domain-containing protein [Neobacillus pocheonensis]
MIPSVIMASEEINFVEKQIKTAHIDIKFPEIYGLSNDQIQNEINGMIYNKVFEFMNEDKLPPEDKNKKNYWGSYAIPFRKDHIISIVFNQFGYLPRAAHPNSGIKSITIDLDRGKALRIVDLFRSPSNYRSILNNIMTNQLKKKRIHLFTDFKGIQNDDQEFYLTNKALVIYYQEDVYTPHAYGPLVFTIPYTDLKNELKYISLW